MKDEAINIYIYIYRERERERAGNGKECNEFSRLYIYAKTKVKYSLTKIKMPLNRRINFLL